MAVSVVRTIGPAFVNTLFSITLRNQFNYDPESGFVGTGFGLEILVLGIKGGIRIMGTDVAESGFFGNHLVWVIMSILVVLAIGIGMLLPAQVWKPEDDENDSDMTDVESIGERVERV
jgi:hypothetical protein